MAKERSLYWDTLKGFLIILVVFGHCGTALGNNLLSSVYIFHMPLFILISGFFSKKTDIINWGGYKRLIIIYLGFNLAYLLLDIGSGISINRLLTPSFALWYILSLIFWRIILQYIPNRLLDKKVLFLTISFLLCIAIGFVPINDELSFQRTFVYWPFFLGGYYLKQTNSIGKFRDSNKLIALVICVSMLVITYLYTPVMYSNASYSSLPSDLITRLIQIVFAVIICGCFLVIGFEKLPVLTELGKYTLLIYLFHPPLIKIMKMACVKTGYTPNVLVAVVITFISIALIYSVRNLKIFKYLK